MAVLRITLSLIFVVCFATPAVAFDIADLEGDWFIQALETSGSRPAGSQPEPGGWLDGFVRFDENGVVTAGQVSGPSDPGTNLDPGSVQVTNDGAVTGTIAGGAEVRGRILPGGQQMILIVTSKPSVPATYSIALLTKFVPGVVNQGDLTGTWLLHSLLIPDFLDGQPAGRAEWAAGEITFSAAGDITGGTLRGSNGQEVTALSGTFTFIPNLNQVLTGALVIGPPLPNATDISFLTGFMSVDKNLVFGTSSRLIDPVTPTGSELSEFGAFVLQRKPTPAVRFTSADLEGRWALLSLQAQEDPGNIGEPLTGTLIVTDGKLTGELTGPGGEVDEIVGGTLTVNADGFVVADFFTEVRSVLASGRMVPDKNLIFGVDDLSADLSVDFTGVGLFTLVKSAADGPPPAPSVVQFRVTTQSVGEGATATVIVDRTGATNTLVTVEFDRIGGTATPDTDFTLPQSPRVLTFQKGQTTQSFDVATLPDQAVEGNETVELKLSNPTGGATVGARTTNTLTITDGAAVQFSAPAYSVKENVASVAITAIRTGGPTTPFTVTYTAIPGTAVAGRDFTLVPGTLTFPTGVTSRSFSVTIKNNTLVDGNRSVMLSLGVPTNGVQNGTPSTATLTIQDDDQPGSFKVDKGTYTVLESAVSLPIIVRRLGTSLAGNVSVGFAIVEGTARSGVNYLVPTSTTLTFNPNETMKTVTVLLRRDNLVDGDKTFTFTLSNPSSGATLDAQSSAVVTIKDVDVAGQVKFSPITYSVRESAENVTLTAVRSGGSAGGVLVDFKTSDGTASSEGEDLDFGSGTGMSGTLTFLAGNMSTKIIIPIRQDTRAEGNETFTVALSNPRGGATLPTTAALGQSATVTIVDDESAFQFNQATYTVVENTPTAVITVLRSGALGTPASVTFTASPGTAVPGQDFTPVSGVLSFPANTASKTFSVPIRNDSALDGDRTVLLALGSPTGGAQLGTQSTATIVIKDDEQAGAFKVDKGTYTVLESAASLPIIVRRLGTNLAGNVSVQYTTGGGNAVSEGDLPDYEAQSGTLLFAPGETQKTVTILLRQDKLVDGDKTFTFTLSNPSSGAALGAPSSAVVTIKDVDLGGQLKFAQAAYTALESVGNVTLTVLRTGGAAGGVTVNFQTVDVTATGSPVGALGSDYTSTPDPRPLTFGPGNSSAAIVIPLTQDDTMEPARTFQVVLSGAAGGAALVAPTIATVTIVDDDSTVQFSGNFIGNFPEIVRTGSLATQAVVEFESEDGTAMAEIDYTPAKGTLTFKPNVRAVTIPLVIRNDIFAEGFETFTLRLHNARGTRLGPNAERAFTITDNDFGGDVGFELLEYTVVEGGFVDVAVVRTGGVGSELTVQWQAGNGSAIAGIDFTPASGSVTFPATGAGSTRQTFRITGFADVVPEENESVPLTLTVNNGAANIVQPTTTLQIQNAAPVFPTIQFGATTYTALLGDEAQITLTRSGGLGTTIEVEVTPSGGTAQQGVHYELPTTTVIFGPNDTSRSLTVVVFDSDASEPDRTVQFGLSITSENANIGPNDGTTLTILGSQARVQFPVPVYSVNEGSGAAVVTVVRQGGIDRQLTVQYATSPGTAVAGRDYTTASGTLTIPSGAQTATFTIPIINNGPSGQTRSLNLALSNPSGNTVIDTEGDTARLDIREGPVYTFELVADNTDEFEGFGGVPSINDGGSVAFKAFLSDERQRVVKAEDGALVTIAASSGRDLFPGSRFPIDASGNVVFLADENDGPRKVVRGAGGALTTLFETNGNLIDVFDPSVSGSGNVAFAAAREAGDAVIFTGPGAGPVTQAFAPVPNVRFGFGTRPSVNDAGRVAFVASTPAGGRTLLLSSGTDLVPIASDVTADTVANFSLNDLGQVAFIDARGSSESSILLAREGTTPTTFVSQGNGFQAFGDVTTTDNSPVISDRGDVAFLGLTTQTFGILTGASPTGNMVIQIGDPLLGSNVSDLQFGGLNASGQIVFLAFLADGRQVIVVATPPLTLADLEVAQTLSTASPALGANVTFTVTARNNGPATATGVQVTDLLPSGYTFVSATPSRGTYSATTGAWAVGTLTGTGSGNTATLTLVGTVLPAGTYNNTASITAAGVTDGNTANNTTTAVVTPVLQADIKVDKTVNNASPSAGANITFTITATNLGPSAATAVQVTDLLPSGYTFVSATPSQGSYVSTSGVWTVGALAAAGTGSSATLQITATVKATGVYNNTATRTASTPTDPNAANNAATVTVTPTSGLAVTTIGPLVGVGRTITGTVTLPSPAPTGGVSVTLTTNPTSFATVAPGTLTIGAGQTSGGFTVTGVAPGVTAINATATGFAPGSVNVTVTSSVISLGALPTLGLGQALSLPISLSTAAPAGGVTVSFSSINPSIATVTPSVFIPQGAQVPSANPQVTGVNIGSTTINATAVGFAPDSRSANVSVSVTFTPTPFNVVTNTTGNITVNISAPAPAGGLTFNLATANTTVATVVSPVTVSAGQTSVQAAVTGGASVAQTTLQASGAGVTSATVTINVTQPPAITFSPQTIGKDLQVQTQVSLGAAAPAGGTSVTLTSGDATKLRLASSGTAAGTGQLTVLVGAGSFGSPAIFIQALDSTGTVTVTVSATGYQTATSTMTLAPSGFIINSPGNFNTTTLSNPTNIQLLPARLTPGTLTFSTNQTIRGGIVVNVPVTATDQAGGSGVGSISTSPVVFDGGDTFATTSFVPGAAGTSQIAVGTPTGFSTPATNRTITATVSSPVITLAPQTIGKDLEVGVGLSLGAPAPAGGLQITVTSGDPSKLLVAASATVAGNANGTLTFNVAQNVTGTQAIFLQALDSTGTVTVTISAPGFQTSTSTMTLVPSGFIINSPGNFNTTTLSNPTNLQLLPARLTPGTLTFSTNQTIRGGIVVNVPVTATDQAGGSGVGSISTSPVVFDGGDTFATTSFVPGAAGTSQIAVGTPTGFSTPATNRTITATVSSPVITLAPQTIGKDLEVGVGLSLGAPAPAGGLQITVTSGDPSKLLVAASATVAGNANGTLTFNVAQNVTGTQAIFLQALDSTGTVTVTISAPGFQTSTSTMTLAPSGFAINNVGNFTTTTFSTPTPIQVLPYRLAPGTLAIVTNQTVRGGLTVNVPITATDQGGGPGVGAIVGSPLVFNGGDTFKQGTFDPAVAGTSLVAVEPPAGFNPPSSGRTVIATVTAPAINFSSTNIQVGRDLQQQFSVTLGATPPGPVTVTVKVASTAIATITTDGTVAGGDTITFTTSTTFAGNFFVQGRAATGTTALSAQAPGFADGASTVTAQPSGFIINSPGNFTTTAGAGNSNIQILSVRLNPTTLNTDASQVVRGGVTVSVPVTATTLTGSGVGTITTSPVIFNANANSIITQFDPAAAGTAAITVGLPTGFDRPSDRQQITVTVNP